MTKITKFPGSKERRDRLKLRARQVECQVSGRWLQFSESASALAGGTFLKVDVMTLDQNESPRKLCELVLVKEQLIEMINSIAVKK